MPDIFDFEGMEWFNIGIGALLLSFVALIQLFVNLSATTASINWTLYATYFGSFFVLGIAYLSKKPLISILAVISTLFMMFTSFIQLDFVKRGNMMIPTGTEVYIFSAAIVIVCLALTILDFLFDFTKLNIKNDYILMTPFSMISLWSLFKLYSGFSALSGLQIVLQILVFVWAVMGAVAVYLSAINKLDDFELGDLTYDNLAFIVIAIFLIVFLASWTTIGVGLVLV